MILTPEIFNGEILIPHANDTSKGEYKRLKTSIELYEDEFLLLALGTMYSEFISGLNDNPILDKWKDLRDGASFELKNRTIDFKGIAILAAYYVYFKHTELYPIERLGEDKGDRMAEDERQRFIIWNKMINEIGLYNNHPFKPTLYNFLNVKDYEDWTIDYSLAELRNRLL